MDDLTEAIQLLERLRTLLLFQIDENGQPKAPLGEIIRTWDEVNEFLIKHTTP